MALAHPCLGMAGSRGLEVGRAGRDAGRLWQQECIMEVLLKSCLALLLPPMMEAHRGHVPIPWLPLVLGFSLAFQVWNS